MKTKISALVLGILFVTHADASIDREYYYKSGTIPGQSYVLGATGSFIKKTFLKIKSPTGEKVLKATKTYAGYDENVNEMSYLLEQLPDQSYPFLINDTYLKDFPFSKNSGDLDYPTKLLKLLSSGKCPKKDFYILVVIANQSPTRVDFLDCLIPARI